MKQQKRNIFGLALASITIVISLVAAVTGYLLPDQLMNNLETLQLDQLPQIQSEVLPLQLIIVGNLILTIVALLFYVSAIRNAGESQVIYIDRHSDEDNSEEIIASEEQHRTYWDSGLVERIFNESNQLKEGLEKVLHKLCKELEAGQGALYLIEEQEEIKKAIFQAGYAFSVGESSKFEIEQGDGIIGQCIKEGQAYNLNKIPEGYIRILSGLGESNPTALAVLPILSEGQVLGVVEIASFTAFTSQDIDFINHVLNQLVEQLPKPAALAKS
ncbi:MULTISPECIES: GAF domain-containing protein [Persicobacter]|uniref:GAF domain-containing protein n=1 Tax=Persicobacter diffluens TaxID=981 RepID=A0AAN5AIX8_9BACT|nr:GAF domain-containing protein [Persicobacter sp. CCB-QB2]GJM60324.1 hypothetical protein PEDI_08760 [Persicobacter diffluens]